MTTHSEDQRVNLNFVDGNIMIFGRDMNGTPFSLSLTPEAFEDLLRSYLKGNDT